MSVQTIEPDDVARRCDDQLTRSREILAACRQLLTSVEDAMRRDAKTIDQLTAESARLTEIFDFMRDGYSTLGARSCALCVYAEGVFVRPCALHREIDMWTRDRSIAASTRSIAEAFQDMLRAAHRAGAASAATGETFETWYQREVLQ